MDLDAFRALSPTTLADVLPRAQVMDLGLRPLYADVPRIAGPAYPVRCAPGDNLMLHAAIHRAPKGSVLVCEAGDHDFAMAGGNVCAYAQQRGIEGLVVDGAVRDLAEIRARRFPVFARGLVPKPAEKNGPGALDVPVTVGGVRVAPGDLVVADEEGIVVVPRADAVAVRARAEARAAKDAAETLDAWATAHRAKVDAALRALGLA